MKAVILAGGFGTRLRPLTLDTPKPIVPIFDRPFLYYQTDLLRQVPEIDEVILSLNYRPDRIEARVGRGADAGLPVRYVVEPEPLGTGGAIKYASRGIDDTILVLNGDVLTTIDLQAVVRTHRERHAQATIVLTPVENPSAYGLVETDDQGNVRRFLEKPDPEDITCNTINAGIYLLEPETFDRIPDDTPWSIERQYFPSLVERSETFVAYVDRGYWLDIGTPAAYVQAHRDLMRHRCPVGPFASDHAAPVHKAGPCDVAPDAQFEGPCFLAAGSVVGPAARIGPETVLGPGCHVGAGAVVEQTILWRDTFVDAECVVRDAILGERCRLDHHAEIGPGVILGSDSTISAHSRVPGTR
ncbi:MAG: NDP-sugar synthase [bacterium]